MKILKRTGLKEIKEVSKTKAEKKAYSQKKRQFEDDMAIVRADSISKSARSRLSAAQTVLNC